MNSPIFLDESLLSKIYSDDGCQVSSDNSILFYYQICELVKEISNDLNTQFIAISNTNNDSSNFDFILEIDIDRRGYMGKYDNFFSILNVLTIGLIPSFTEIEYLANIKLTELKSKSTNSITYLGGFKIWRHLIFLPAVPFTNGIQSNIEDQLNMIRLTTLNKLFRPMYSSTTQSPLK